MWLNQPGKHVQAAKLAYLDSLRGIASIIVILAHYVAVFYPYAIFGDSYRRSSSWEDWLRVPPLSLVMSGHYAVCLFFILSGYVLSIKFFSGAARLGELTQAVLKRPVRLGGVVLITVLLGYALMQGNLLPWSRPGEGLEKYPWLATFWQTTPTWQSFLVDAALHPFSSGTTYNPPLWTIEKELVGSYIVFATVGVALRLNQRWRLAVLAVLVLVTFKTLYVGFIIGMLFAAARSLQQVALPERVGGRIQRILRPLTTCLLLGSGLWLGSQLHYVAASPADMPADMLAGWAATITKTAHDFGTGGAAMLGAALTFAACWSAPPLQRALDARPLRFLGRISFAVYALHFLLLGSLSVALDQRLMNTLGRDLSALVTTLVSFACLIPLAALVTRWIDRPSIVASSIVADQLRRMGAKIAAGCSRLRLQTMGECRMTAGCENEGSATDCRAA